MTNYYDILGISKTATYAEIKAAYRKKAIMYHPDKNPLNPQAHSIFVRIQQAYDTLSDPAKKSRYDYSLNTQSYVNTNNTNQSYQSYQPPRPYYQNNNHTTQQTYTRTTPKKDRFEGAFFATAYIICIIPIVLFSFVILDNLLPLSQSKDIVYQNSIYDGRPMDFNPLHSRDLVVTHKGEYIYLPGGIAYDYMKRGTEITTFNTLIFGDLQRVLYETPKEGTKTYTDEGNMIDNWPYYIIGMINSVFFIRLYYKKKVENQGILLSVCTAIAVVMLSVFGISQMGVIN